MDRGTATPMPSILTSCIRNGRAAGRLIRKERRHDTDSASPIDGQGLPALEGAAARDLALLCWPGKPWVPQESGVRDVVVIGGGMCGMLAWLALRTGGIHDIRVLDRSPQGREGAWMTYARMETLRSPKHLTGPAFGMGALTFRAWFEAQFGAFAWATLDKIPRPMWMDYLCWYRDVLALPVENEVEVRRVTPLDGLLRLELAGPAAEEDFILTRRLIMATGREGLGQPSIPGFVAGLPRGEVWAHSSDAIDFTSLATKRVGVVGVGASAVDNAAEALEAGCAECRLLIRRQEMPRINKMMGIGSFGFTAGFPAMKDEWRWRFMRYSFVTQTPAPRGSTLRVSRHENAYFHFGAGVERVERVGDALRVEVAGGRVFELDFLVLGTGFTVEPEARTELGAAAGEVKLWRDAYTPPPEEAHAEMESFPYLSDSFAFQEREPGRAPWLRNVYCFNYGAAGQPGQGQRGHSRISDGAAWLTREIGRDALRRDLERHWQEMLDYAKARAGRQRMGGVGTGNRRPERQGRLMMPESTALDVAGLDGSGAVSAAVESRARVFEMTQAAEDAVLRPRETGAWSHAPARCTGRPYRDAERRARTRRAVRRGGRGVRRSRRSATGWRRGGAVARAGLHGQGGRAHARGGRSGHRGAAGGGDRRCRYRAALRVERLSRLSDSRDRGAAADAGRDAMTTVVRKFTRTVPHWQARVTPLDLAQANEAQLDALQVTPSNTKVSDYVLTLALDVESSGCARRSSTRSCTTRAG